MANRAGTIRVDKAKLIASITKKKEELQATYDAEVKEHKAQFISYRDGLVEHLKDAAAKAKKSTEFEHLGFIVSNSYGEVRLPNYKNMPRRPEKDRVLEYAEQMLERLALCPDDILELRDGDDYLRFI